MAVYPRAADDSAATLSAQRRYNPGRSDRLETRKDILAQLTDSYNRKMDYLRISVTDRCNFRCQYCMPEDIQFQDKSHILTLEAVSYTHLTLPTKRIV